MNFFLNPPDAFSSAVAEHGINNKQLIFTKIL